jgi:hypothetical protein
VPVLFEPALMLVDVVVKAEVLSVLCVDRRMDLCLLKPLKV